MELSAMTYSVTNKRYRLYIDETGTHGIPNDASLNEQYLCLVGCAMPRGSYVTSFVPSLSAIKTQFFGTDAVALHRHHIEKQTGIYSVLVDKSIRDQFNYSMVTFYGSQDYTIFSVTIDKASHFSPAGVIEGCGRVFLK